MSTMFTIQARLVDFLAAQAAQATIVDVRIGLGYCAVAIDSGQAGLAWTPTSKPGCCTHFKLAGSMQGHAASELLGMLSDKQSTPLARCIGLATANALLANSSRAQTMTEDVLSIIKVGPQDRVAMVGYFAPVISALRKQGCGLDIIELNRERGDTLAPEEGRKSLARCTVAIITGTSLITGTCDDVLAYLGQPRAAVLLGPSSPLCGQAFSGTKLTHIAGARVRDVEGVLRVVSEGGGTPLLKPYLSFETLSLREGA